MKQIGTEKTMTVKEIADLLGVDESTIRKIGKNLFPISFTNGIITRLNEIQVTAIKMKLGKNSELPPTEFELLLWQKKIEIWRENRIKELTEQLENAKPKIEFFDTVADCKDAVDLRKVASVLNIKNLGRNKLFAFLRELKILDNNNIPYRKYQDAGYFRVIEQAFKDGSGTIHVSFKTHVYQKGIDFIQKKLIEGGK
jgi:anti-repressor protein